MIGLVQSDTSSVLEDNYRRFDPRLRGAGWSDSDLLVSEVDDATL